MSISRAVTALQKLYPLHLAESWDNVGLLVDTLSSTSTSTSTSNPKSNTTKVLLTVDLTTRVVNEAILQNVRLIVAYHPFIFKGIKSLKSTDPQHVSLLRLIQANIAVYSPHTAVDSVAGGVNDWLVNGCVGGNNKLDSKVISESKSDPGNGCGRVAYLEGAITLREVIGNLKTHLNVKDLLVGCHDLKKDDIKSIAVCAGSGSGVFADLKEDVDLYVTGEMSHHEVLLLKEKGKAVICANHSNTERGYLQEMKSKLEKELGDEEFEIIVSQEDADPFVFV